MFSPVGDYMRPLIHISGCIALHGRDDPPTSEPFYIVAVCPSICLTYDLFIFALFNQMRLELVLTSKDKTGPNTDQLVTDVLSHTSGCLFRFVCQMELELVLTSRVKPVLTRDTIFYGPTLPPKENIIPPTKRKYSLEFLMII